MGCLGKDFLSRRERLIKGAAGALQPKSHDLTQYRRQSARERRVRVRSEDAAGALAFAATDRVLKDEQTYGDPLASLLLRLKYAEQFSKTLFTQAHLILLDRYGGLATKKSLMMSAIAFMALFEWCHDECPRGCRGRRAGARDPLPCPVCKPTTPKDEYGYDKPTARREVVEITRTDGSRIEREIATSTPSSGCSKCNGTGVVPRPAPKSKGVKCSKCGNTGHMEWRHKARWAFVTRHFADLQREYGLEPITISYDSFRSHWLQRYYHFLDILEGVDRKIAAGIDFGVSPSDNRATSPLQEEDVGLPPDDPAAANGDIAP